MTDQNRNMRSLEISESQDINNSIDCLSSFPSVLKLLPGYYNQDMILRPNLIIEGSGLADLDFTVIKGSHRFPKNGKIGFKNIKFSNKYDIFTALDNSNINFLFYSCAFEIQKGYPLKIPRVKGQGTFFDCWVYGEENGFIDNSEGEVTFKLFNLTSESKKNTIPMMLNSKSILFNVHITHDIEIRNKKEYCEIQGGSWIEGKIR